MPKASTPGELYVRKQVQLLTGRLLLEGVSPFHIAQGLGYCRWRMLDIVADVRREGARLPVDIIHLAQLEAVGAIQRRLDL